ncbi:MAG: hypothetical protein WCG80_18030 [Spirochaetales bacterium]
MITEKHHQLLLTAKETGKPFSVTTRSYLPADQAYIDEVLRVFLAELGLPPLFDQLSYCIRELADNAKKANTKRLFFQHSGLRIDEAQDYLKGMETFKTNTLGNQSFYLDLLEKGTLSIKIEFLLSRESCSIAVRNNSLILEAELARVRDRVQKAYTYASLQDAFSEVLDESEGAGLGIIVLILMLRKVGFDGEFFQIDTLGDETVARIILPLTVD